MGWHRLAVAAALISALGASGIAVAQTAPSGTAAPPTTAETSRPRKAPGSRAARPTREPTAGQMAARERQKKCGAEWREAKAAGKTGSQKWPQYWSQCNARMKGNSA